MNKNATNHYLQLTLTWVSVSKRFFGNNIKSTSLFSHFITKYFKVPQRNVKITIYINISNKSLVQTWVCKV